MIWLIHIFSISILLLVSEYFKQKKLFYYGTFLYVIFLYGQRWQSGTDFPGYLRYYVTGYTKWNEFAYFSLQEIYSSLNLYFGLFLLSILFIIMINFYRFVDKFDKNTSFMIFLFLFSEIFFAQLSQLRQFAAISFFIMAYYYMFHQKYVKSLINIIFAVGFHFSALFVSLILLIKIRVNKLIALILLSLAGILPFINIQFIFTLAIFSRYSGYLDTRFNVPLSSFHYLKFYSLLLIIIFYIVLIDRIEESKIEQFIMNGIILNMLLYGFSFQFALLIRISSFFKIFEIIFLVYFFDRLRNTSKSLVFTAVTVYLLGVFGGIVLTDPYDLGKYEFEPIRVFENRSETFLRSEINRFYDED